MKEITGGLIAVKKFSVDIFIVTIYKEQDTDGFIITAYLTNKIQKFKKKRVLWEQKK